MTSSETPHLFQLLNLPMPVRARPNRLRGERVLRTVAESPSRDISSSLAALPASGENISPVGRKKRADKQLEKRILNCYPKRVLIFSAFI